MGSAGSRMGGEVGRLPAKILPLFRRRSEEITTRRSVCMPLLGGATASKKTLLNEDTESAEQSGSFASRCPWKERAAAEEKEGDVKPTVEPLTVEDEGDSKEESGDNGNGDANDAGLDEEERKGEEEQRDEEDEEGEEKMKKNKEDNRPWPASPSFRIYCVDPLPDDDDDDDDGKADSFNSQAGASHETDASKGLSESVVSRVSSEGSGTRRVRKHKKGRRLRRVLPKGRPVRKLLNMRSCYYLSCSSSDRAHLLTEKNVVA